MTGKDIVTVTMGSDPPRAFYRNPPQNPPKRLPGFLRAGLCGHAVLRALRQHYRRQVPRRRGRRRPDRVRPRGRAGLAVPGCRRHRFYPPRAHRLTKRRRGPPPHIHPPPRPGARREQHRHRMGCITTVGLLAMLLGRAWTNHACGALAHLVPYSTVCCDPPFARRK